MGLARRFACDYARRSHAYDVPGLILGGKAGSDLVLKQMAMSRSPLCDIGQMQPELKGGAVTLIAA